eukprot:15272662-Alexandrium_andersonii.AAC.1
MHSYGSHAGLPLAQTGMNWDEYLQAGYDDERSRFDPIWDGENRGERPTDEEIERYSRRSIFTSQRELFKDLEAQILEGQHAQH